MLHQKRCHRTSLEKDGFECNGLFSERSASSYAAQLSAGSSGPCGTGSLSV